MLPVDNNLNGLRFGNDYSRNSDGSVRVRTFAGNPNTPIREEIIRENGDRMTTIASNGGAATTSNVAKKPLPRESRIAEIKIELRHTETELSVLGRIKTMSSLDKERQKILNNQVTKLQLELKQLACSLAAQAIETQRNAEGVAKQGSYTKIEHSNTINGKLIIPSGFTFHGNVTFTDNNASAPTTYTPQDMINESDVDDEKQKLSKKSGPRPGKQ